MRWQRIEIDSYGHRRLVRYPLGGFTPLLDVDDDDNGLIESIRLSRHVDAYGYADEPSGVVSALGDLNWQQAYDRLSRELRAQQFERIAYGRAKLAKKELLRWRALPIKPAKYLPSEEEIEARRRQHSEATRRRHEQRAAEMQAQWESARQAKYEQLAIKRRQDRWEREKHLWEEYDRRIHVG